MRQLSYFFISTLNLFLLLTPTFFLRKILIEMIGGVVHKSATLHRGVRITSVSGRIKIGKNTTVNRNVFLDNRMPIEIGENVTIAHESRIYTLGHDIDSNEFETKGGRVQIGDNSVLFAGSKIMPGVTIGQSAVILPFSVVTKDVPDSEVWGGNPAYRVRRRRVNEIAYSSRYQQWLGN